MTKEPLAIRGGMVALPQRPGLGIEIDLKQIEQAHALYKSHGLGARDYAIAMRYLIPGLGVRQQEALSRALIAAARQRGRACRVRGTELRSLRIHQ